MRVYYYELVPKREYHIVVNYDDNHIPIDFSYEFKGKFIKRVYDESCSS